jgi:hypothetical protein
MESRKTEAESMPLSAEDSDACQAWIFNPPSALDKTICELDNNSDIEDTNATESMPILIEDSDGCRRWKFNCGHYSGCFSPQHIFDKAIHEIEAMEEDMYFEKAAKSYYFSGSGMRYIDNVPNHGMLSREGVEDENVSQKVGCSVEVIDLCDEVENLKLSPSLLADNSAVQPSEGEQEHPR